ncbi:LamG-like jellyroll fold domain-containing protein [Streptomyces sp. NPDC015127]|uniref:LamG-like jellyroll fold domain-containing protein n=1 Tax=Streptomyces sp. NPDC015127 TaxID=3364939 RepID=UPI0036F6AA3B
MAVALGIGLVGAGPPAPASAAELPVPALEYTFDADDLAAGRIADSSGHGLDGTLVNGESAALVDGAAGGKALDLPGGAVGSAGAHVRLPKGALAGARDLTVSARVRWDGGTTPWQWIYALGKDTGRYLFSTPYNNDGRLRTAVTTSGGGGEAQVTGSAALPDKEWKTLTVTLDTSADRLTTYLDGVAVASTRTEVDAGELIDTSATFAGYLGKSFYLDPLFAGAVDEFAVYHQALSAEQVAQTVGETPTPTGLAQEEFELRTTTGTAPDLPATVRATYSDGYDRQVAADWDPVDPDAYAAPGSFTVSGKAAGRTVTAKVTVVREGELVVDLGKQAGAFHGGASGTLYGLYGQDVPTNNLIEGMNLRTVATKAQDGPQHPGADALEVVKPLADSTDGDVYIYMTDIHRGFPYQWEGDTPAEKMRIYKEKIAAQVDQVLKLPAQYQDNIVFVPFNEPEGNMFGTGQWSYNGTSWLDRPDDYFAAWDDVYRLIKGRMPDARIAGPNTSVLFTQVQGFLRHAVQAGTVPQVMTWHELSHPEQIRTSVKRYRGWEKEIFAGSAHEGTQLPININEYAYNYHTSVPGQMVQWISAIEESKVDADIAYWNIDGNLSDSAVQANRGNGQWWLYQAYGSMTGRTVQVSPPFPGENYTMQGVAALDEKKRQARAIFGGSDGGGHIRFDHVPGDVFGDTVHAWIREIPWTGQIGDSAPPRLIAEQDVQVRDDGSVAFDFGGDARLPALEESSAYEIVIAPGRSGTKASAPTALWEADYEAEDAAHTGSGYSRNGPEGSPSNVAKFYTSGGYNVGGLRTGSDVKLDFTVDVPKDGTYDLSVFANSLNTFDKVEEQGPTNVFLTVDGGAEQDLFLPLGYKWVVWDHTDTTVELTKGTHTLSLAAKSVDGKRATKGDAIVDRLTLTLPNPEAGKAVYEGELAALDGGHPVYGTDGVSGAGAAQLQQGDSATFWVYSPADTESTLTLATRGSGRAQLTVNGQDTLRVTPAAKKVAVSLSGGVNKVTVTGKSGTLLVDHLGVEQTSTTLAPAVYQAEDAELAGSAAPARLSLASDGSAVRGIGGEPGNGNTATFRVTAGKDGLYAMRVRYSNPEQSEATHYNPDPLARPADISVNGAEPRRTLFPHTFHENNFWEQTVTVRLKKGSNTIRFSAEELPNFDGTSYASDTFPGILLRSRYAPVLDKITIARFADRP